MTARRNLTGRPPMTDGKRIKKIDARFTEDEYKIVLDLEKTLGISKTDLVRTKLLENAPQILINAKELITAIDAIGSELGRAGNNINQLARHANTLQKRGLLPPEIVDRFNALLSAYIQNQEQLEVSLRKIIRLIAR
ncbi:MAG: plasmid mobilization relaxosome protein MobC [Bacteroidetes bacterium]|nr:plasmid mobilization relaxosome protein MobC [Bacteroidota bacterium]